MKQHIAERRAQREQERAAFTGDCFECRDQGFIDVPYTGRKACESCARGVAFAEQERQRLARERLADFLAAGEVPLRRRMQTFKTFPAADDVDITSVQTFAKRWAEVDADHSRGLVLTGSYGTGKTGLLIAALGMMLRYYVAQGAPWVRAPLWFVTSTDLFDLLRAGYDNGKFAEHLQRAKTVQLLALDDLGTEKPTEWVQERLFSIVNARYENELPTCVTTNYGMEALAERIGPRVVERLLETCDVLAIEGKNLRTV